MRLYIYIYTYVCDPECDGFTILPTPDSLISAALQCLRSALKILLNYGSILAQNEN